MSDHLPGSVPPEPTAEAVPSPVPSPASPPEPPAPPARGQRRIVRPPGEDGAQLADASDSERYGWGTDPEQAERDRGWYERQRPPHHG